MRKVGSGIYKRIKGVNVNNENHPWRKQILVDVILASKKSKKEKLKEFYEVYSRILQQ